ncbi:Uncharacterised protein [Vibrio cholerae]|uniref:Uncharacterized protein n=1 Tax=Vibrio cholerae TaxID=666 RepID=A0A655PIB3_VIBCL|nr:Uncharacterised protein [Vibrio cholerae]
MINHLQKLRRANEFVVVMRAFWNDFQQLLSPHNRK